MGVGLVACLAATSEPSDAAPGPDRVTGVQTQAAAQVTIDRVGPVDSTGALKPGYTVVHRFGDATCSRPSFETGNAYRCTTPQSAANVYDPCWVSTTSTRVFCEPLPWSRHVVALRVTGGYDDGSPFASSRRPWGLRIERAGGLCLYDPGSVVAIHGRDALYTCRSRIVLAGSIAKRHRHWRIRAYRRVKHHENSYRSLGWQRVHTAWFGRRSNSDSSSG